MINKAHKCKKSNFNYYIPTLNILLVIKIFMFKLKLTIVNTIDYLMASLNPSRFSIAMPTPLITQNNGSSAMKEATFVL